MPAQFRFREAVSEAGSGINADRCGMAGRLAWVIDGATDAGPERLLPGGSDAAWFAAQIDARLTEWGHAGDDRPLPGLLQALAADANRLFIAQRSRAPIAVHEHPSAAGILIQLIQMADGTPGIDILSLADCQLVVAVPNEPPRCYGVDPEVGAGDPGVVAAIETYRTTVGDAPIGEVRTGIWSHIRTARDMLNQPGGYGVFSVLPTPPQFVHVTRIATPPGSLLLLATDGFTRLSDVFRRCPVTGLLDWAERDGLAAMLTSLRALERDDAECRRHRRTKSHDDATALRLDIILAA
jgi:hypothetical protein